MRYIAAVLLCLCCFCAKAQAETVLIEKVPVAYAIPSGFALANGLFPMNLKALDEEFGMNTVVFAIFIPQADLTIRQAKANAEPSWYVHLTYDNLLSKVNMDTMGFAAITWTVEKVIGRQYTKPDFKQKLADIISGGLGRKLTIKDMAQKGFVKTNSDARSMLAYGNGMLMADTGLMEEMALASLTTFFMRKGKLITIVQASRIQSEKDLPAFTEKALKIVEEIKKP